MRTKSHRDTSVNAKTDDPALNLLNTIFGYPAFRGEQREIVGHLAAGGDALVLMPTGGGKRSEEHTSELQSR